MAWSSLRVAHETVLLSHLSLISSAFDRNGNAWHKAIDYLAYALHHRHT